MGTWENVSRSIRQMRYREHGNRGKVFPDQNNQKGTIPGQTRCTRHGNRGKMFPVPSGRHAAGNVGTVEKYFLSRTIRKAQSERHDSLADALHQTGNCGNMFPIPSGRRAVGREHGNCGKVFPVPEQSERFHARANAHGTWEPWEDVSHSIMVPGRRTRGTWEPWKCISSYKTGRKAGTVGKCFPFHQADMLRGTWELWKSISCSRTIGKARFPGRRAAPDMGTVGKCFPFHQADMLRGTWEPWKSISCSRTIGKARFPGKRARDVGTVGRCFPYHNGTCQADARGEHGNRGNVFPLPERAERHDRTANRGKIFPVPEQHAPRRATGNVETVGKYFWLQNGTGGMICRHCRGRRAAKRGNIFPVVEGAIGATGAR
ncbi:hypothetical protein BJ322DRAFT_1023212 [Thelephora terrestris]|uniref:Uncharacterized protein n=1 Tax=Thelephora terrestris TaxID=56493 RepID=A0A9P6H7Z7_9AGAM|nr:hypothetical protein BJ322DRAFT_1023212 [Thelephora terrestris]